MKIFAYLAIIATLFGGIVKKPQPDDEPGMEYKDEDYRTQYANALDFDSCDGQPVFAVAFLGCGDRMDFRHEYVEKTFSQLDNHAIEQIGHIEYEVFDEKSDTWACAVGDSGFFEFMTTRYVKEEK